MYLSNEAITKHKADKKRFSPCLLILSISLLSSRFRAHAKLTDAQPANMAKPALVIEVLSKEDIPKVKMIKKAPARKINSNRMPTTIFITVCILQYNSYTAITQRKINGAYNQKQELRFPAD